MGWTDTFGSPGKTIFTVWIIYPKYLIRGLGNQNSQSSLKIRDQEYKMNMNRKLKLIYSLMFVIGVALIYASRGSFTRDSLLSGFGIAATLTASYLWIRLDWWRSNNTIKELSGSNESIARDLISKKADSRVALVLLMLVALAQALLT